jgi:hypothetical protein
MPSMTEELSRIAHGIAASRRQRAQIAGARPRIVRERRREVATLLHGMTAARQRMGREQRRQAAAERRLRRDEAKTLLSHFNRALVTQHRRRLGMAAEQRVRAAAFMRELTGSVAAMRDVFSAGQAARARACRELGHHVRQQLAGYTRDRWQAMIAWTGTSAARPSSPPRASASERHRGNHRAAGGSGHSS